MRIFNKREAITKYEGKVVETYMESYICGIRPDETFMNMKNLEIILKFLIREKRIEKLDLFHNLWNVLRGFKLNNYIQDKSFRDEEVQFMLRRL